MPKAENPGPLIQQIHLMLYLPQTFNSARRPPRELSSLVQSKVFWIFHLTPKMVKVPRSTDPVDLLNPLDAPYTFHSTVQPTQRTLLWLTSRGSFILHLTPSIEPSTRSTKSTRCYTNHSTAPAAYPENSPLVNQRPHGSLIFTPKVPDQIFWFDIKSTKTMLKFTQQNRIQAHFNFKSKVWIRLSTIWEEICWLYRAYESIPTIPH